VDWWALGVIAFEMITGFPPFNSNTVEAVYENIVTGRIRCCFSLCHPSLYLLVP
jgi:serine/threonine protein kinase